MYWKYTIVCFLAGRDQPGAAGPGADRPARGNPAHHQ